MTWRRIFQNQIWTFISFYLEYLIVGFAFTSTVLSSESFMLDTIKIITIPTNNNPSLFFQPTGETVCLHYTGFFSCFPVCRRENCVWKVITEEINWKTCYIISSQIFKPVVNNSHCLGQKGPLTNADSGETISLKFLITIWQQTFLQTSSEKQKQTYDGINSFSQ